MEWDEKSDIWSLACILAELYSGEPLFDARHDDEHAEMIEKVVGEFPRWMRRGSDRKPHRRVRRMRTLSVRVLLCVGHHPQRAQNLQALHQILA